MTVLRSGAATDVGRIRTVNQDLPLERVNLNLYAVADGMGGHVGGEVAARLAVDMLDEAFEKSPSVDGLRRAFSEANTAVWEQSQVNADLRGMGTTLTAMALVGGMEGNDVLALANVGDSRAYVFSEGEIVQVTADHSLAEERMRHGEMTEAEAAVHPQRHILTRALGVSPEVETDMWELHLRGGDRVLLCSDGLSNEVDIDEIAEVLGSVGDPEEAARRLVDVANAHGGADNITVVIVDVQVGEDGSAKVSRVTPLGRRGFEIIVPTTAANGISDTPGAEDASTGEPGVGTATESSTRLLGAAAVTTANPALRPDDTLAPGSRLGFGSETTTLAESGPRSDEFFLGTGPVPVARATAKVPPPPTPDERPPEKETRGQRRRRLGIPRRVTPRVIGFILLLVAVPVAAYYVLRWYAYDNWIVTLQGDQVVVKQGQPGGVLWFHPRVAYRYNPPVTTSQLAPAALAPLKSGVSEASLKDAKNYVTSVTVPAFFFAPSTTTTTSPFKTSTSTTGPVASSTSTTRAVP